MPIPRRPHSPKRSRRPSPSTRDSRDRSRATGGRTVATRAAGRSHATPAPSPQRFRARSSGASACEDARSDSTTTPSTSVEPFATRGPAVPGSTWLTSRHASTSSTALAAREKRARTTSTVRARAATTASTVSAYLAPDSATRAAARDASTRTSTGVNRGTKAARSASDRTLPPRALRAFRPVDGAPVSECPGPTPKAASCGAAARRMACSVVTDALASAFTRSAGHARVSSSADWTPNASTPGASPSRTRGVRAHEGDALASSIAASRPATTTESVGRDSRSAVRACEASTPATAPGATTKSRATASRSSRSEPIPWISASTPTPKPKPTP